MFWTNDDLVSQVILKSMAPTNQITLSTQNILDLASDELLALLSPLIASYHSNYYETLVTLPTTAVASGLQIPYRALMSRVNDIILTDANGLEIQVPFVSYSENAARPNFINTPQSPVCYIRNDRIFFNPTNIIGTVKVTFYMRPGRLVPLVNASQVVTVGAGSVTVNTPVPGVVTGTPFDVIDSKPISVNKLFDQTATVAGSTLTFSGASNLSVGDYIITAGYSPVPQIPYEFFPILTQRTAARVLDTLGDREGASQLRGAATEFLSASLNILAPRAANHPRYIVNTSGPGKVRAYNKYRRGY